MTKTIIMHIFQWFQGVKTPRGLLVLLSPSMSDGNFHYRVNVNVLYVHFDKRHHRNNVNDCSSYHGFQERLWKKSILLLSCLAAVCSKPPPDSCFTVVIQVCSLLCPSFKPSPFTPSRHCSIATPQPVTRNCFERRSTVTAELLLVKLWLVGSFSCRTLLLFFAVIYNNGGFRTHSQFSCPLGREGWLGPLPPLKLLCAAFAYLTRTPCCCELLKSVPNPHRASRAIIWLL